MKFQIEVNEKQLQTIITALKMLERIGLKQYSIVLERIPNLDYDSKILIEKFIRKLEGCDLHENANYGIAQRDLVPEESRLAYEIFMILISELSWARAEHPKKERWEHGTKYMSYIYDGEPLKVTDEPLAKCKKI